jgi:subtilisin family serine protease
MIRLRQFGWALVLAGVGFAANAGEPILWTDPGLPPKTDGTYQMWTPGVGVNNANGDYANGGFMNSARSTGAEALWNIGVTGQGVSAAVIDGRVFTDHEKFVGKIVADISNPISLYSDHGTHVAGTVVGMAPGAKLIVGNYFFYEDVSKLDVPNAAVFNDIAANATKYNIVAVNNSWGAPHPNTGYAGDYYTDPNTVAAAYPLTAAAVQNLLAAGVITVAATGNDGEGDIMGYPNGLPGVLSVGALSRYGLIAEFSNQYQKDGFILLAPGVDIYSAVASGDNMYQNMPGTSMASPHVTGAIALLASGARNATPAEIITALYQSAARVNYNQTVSKELVDVSSNIDQSTVDNLRNALGITRQVNYDNASLDDWRYVTRLVQVANGLQATTTYSAMSLGQIVDAVLYNTGNARADFTALFNKLGGEAELNYTDYGFLRVDKAYKYLLAQKTEQLSGVVAADGGRVGAEMAQGLAQHFGGVLSEQNHLLYQRLAFMSPEQRRDTLRQISPSLNAAAVDGASLAVGAANRQIVSRFERARMNTLYADRLASQNRASAGGEPEFSLSGIYGKSSELWAQGLGVYGHRDGTKNVAGFDEHYAGAAFGYAARADEWRYGAFGTWANFGMNGTDGNANGNFLSVGVNGGWSAEKFFVNALGAYNVGIYDVNRGIVAPGVFISDVGGGAMPMYASTLGWTGKSTNTTHGFSAFLSGGYDFVQTRGWTVGARAEGGAVFAHNVGYDERGADGLNLRVDSFNAWRLDGGAGLEVAKIIAPENFHLGHFLLSARVRGMYGAGFGDSVSGEFASSGAKFRVAPEYLKSAYVMPEASLRWQVNDRLGFSATYQGRFSGEYRQHAGIFGASLGF